VCWDRARRKNDLKQHKGREGTLKEGEQEGEVQEKHEGHEKVWE